MKTSDESYAVVTLEAWYHKYQDYFKRHGATVEFINTGHGSAYVDIDTKKYISRLTAWNHASCLDIETIEIKSEKSTFPTVGDCETKNIFEKHLENFIQWFKEEYEKIA